MNNSHVRIIDEIILEINGILKGTESVLCKIGSISEKEMNEAQKSLENMQSIELFNEIESVLGELDKVCCTFREAADYIHNTIPLLNNVKWDIENKTIGAASCRTEDKGHRKDGNS